MRTSQNSSSFVEHSAGQPCRSGGMFMATGLTAPGYNDSSHVGLKVQSVLFPVIILLFRWFSCWEVSPLQGSGVGIAVSREEARCPIPFWRFSKSLSIVLPANTAYSSSKRSCKLNSRMDSTNFTTDQLIQWRCVHTNVQPCICNFVEDTMSRQCMNIWNHPISMHLLVVYAIKRGCSPSFHGEARADCRLVL